MKEESLETKHPYKKRGIIISVKTYNTIVKFIMQQMDNLTDPTLTQLLKNAEQTLNINPEISPLVYHVKLDLEARGWIRLSSTNYLHLTAEGLTKRRSILEN